MPPAGLTPAEHAMLGLVFLGPRHGYEIAAHFGPEGDLGMVCQLPMSLLYAQLKRLESLGYLGGTTEVQSNRPPRRVYHITPEGQAEFWRWLDQPPAKPCLQPPLSCWPSVRETGNGLPGSRRRRPNSA